VCHQFAEVFQEAIPMKIDITSILSEAGLHLEQKGSATFSFSDVHLTKPLEFDLRFTNIGNAVLLDGTVESEVSLNCGSCLSDFAYPLHLELNEEFLSTYDAKRGAEEDMTPEELSIFTYGDDRLLSPDEAIRQSILLNLPMQPFCSPSCKGLCPACGANRNEGECGCTVEKEEPVEDRWAPLKALKAPTGTSKRRRNPRA